MAKFTQISRAAGFGEKRAYSALTCLIMRLTPPESVQGAGGGGGEGGDKIEMGKQCADTSNPEANKKVQVKL